MDYTIPMSMIDQTAKIKELTAQLAERDAEIEKLKASNRARYAENKELYGHWQQALTENAALREEVESLKEVQGICEVCEVEAIKHADKARKRTAQEIIQYIQSGLRRGTVYYVDDTDLKDIKQSYGLEG